MAQNDGTDPVISPGDDADASPLRISNGVLPMAAPANLTMAEGTLIYLILVPDSRA